MEDLECRFCDDDVRTSEYVCDGHQWVLGDAVTFGTAMRPQVEEWEKNGRIKVCKNCGSEFQRETRVVYTHELPWGRRVYRWTKGYCSEGCRKGISRAKAMIKKLGEGKCGFCGRKIVGRRADAKYCDDMCKRLRYNHQRRR